MCARTRNVRTSPCSRTPTPRTLDYATLARAAEAIGAGLQARGVQPGQTVAIMLPTCREYFTSFFGVLAAGAIPVPIYPPARAAQIEDHLRRHGRILGERARRGAYHRARGASAGAPAAAAGTRARLHRHRRRTHGCHGGGKPPALRAADIALLQYTSGSTGNPEGVILTHANLLANIRAMGETVRATSTDVFVSWMPLYHDMGLIGAWLGSLYYAIPLVVMSPLAFLARPEHWLWAIHRHRATISGAPNFGYELCLRRIADDDLQGLDLSSWRLAFNGAEPVSPETLRRFSARFARYGFRPETMAPVYGLAECAVGLTFPPPGRAPLYDRVEREALMRTGRAAGGAGRRQRARIRRLRPAAAGSPGSAGGQRRLRSGRARGRPPGIPRPVRDQRLLPQPRETRRLLRDGWLDSGDLAYMARGELFITGRVKDIIIRAGRNIHPQELEEAVGNLHDIRKGCVAVFGVPDPATTMEQLVVLAETRETVASAHERLRTRISALAVDLTGIAPDDIVLAPPHSVLKTSSGKVRRTASRELYERGEIGRTLPVWRQIARLAWAGMLPQLRRVSWTATSLLYAAYVWLVFWLLAPLVWTAVALLPRPTWALAAIRAAAQLLLWLTGTPWRVRGLEQLPPGPSIVVANHASYIDGIVLTAALPGVSASSPSANSPRAWCRACFCATSAPSSWSVSRRCAASRTRAAWRARALAGKTLIFFPEGTFTRTPGLRAFHLGAFAAAVEAGLPLVPVALAGTRSILRADQWFPRRGAVSVTVAAPIRPVGGDWAAAIRLRDAARAEILRHCGEPDAGGAPLE